MAVKFGIKARQSPTPRNIGNGLDIASAILGASVGYITTASYIPANITIILSSIFGFLVTLCQVLKPFFGVKNPPLKVNIEDVTEMEEPDKKVDISKFPPTSNIPSNNDKGV